MVDRVRVMLRTEHEAVVASRLGLSRPTLARLVAGMPLQPGSLALVRERLGT